MNKSEILSNVCCLCLQGEKLVSSHVIPKFKFRRIKNRDGKYHVVSLDPEVSTRQDQRELQEKLLCQHCDNVILGKAEAYLADFLFGECGVSRKCLAGEGVLMCSGLDYGLLQRALLSILWRMHVSSQDFFKFINLGERHSEKLRISILAQEPLDELAYPVTCLIPLIDGDHYLDWLLTPHFDRIDGNRFYRCLIAGFVFVFIVGSAPVSKVASPFVLKGNGTWQIPRGEIFRMPHLHDLFARVSEAERLRKLKNKPR